MVIFSPLASQRHKLMHARAGSVVEQHRAGAADAVLATEMRTGEIKLVAKQKSARLSAAPLTPALRGGSR